MVEIKVLEQIALSLFKTAPVFANQLGLEHDVLADVVC